MGAAVITKRLFKEEEEPIGCLRHEATKTCFFVYKNINIFQRLMLRVCFGLRYERM